MEPSSGDDGEPEFAAWVIREFYASMEPSSGDEGEVQAVCARTVLIQASMEPSSGDDGESIVEMIVCPHNRVLQWSRRPGTTERPTWALRTCAGLGELQWSRRPGTTESAAAAHLCAAILELASMEPSSGDDGEGNFAKRGGSASGCFNGAVILGRRRAASARSASQSGISALQWSRRPGTTERRAGGTVSRSGPATRFNGAVVRGRRRVADLTGADLAGADLLQWSRRPGTTERVSRNWASSSRMAARFNGAVVRGRRRARDADVRGRLLSRFNGAVVRGRRRGARQPRARQPPGRASMEPSSGDDGEPGPRIKAGGA